MKTTQKMMQPAAVIIPKDISISKINPQNHTFVKPQKRIKSPQDMQTWQSSKAYKEYMGFLVKLQGAIVGKGISETELKPKFQPWIDMFSELEAKVEEIQPVEQKMRFGNKAFKTWHEEAMKVSIQVFLKKERIIIYYSFYI